jgi:peptidylprolyl isomerase
MRDMKLLALIAAVCAVLAVAACGDDDSSAESTTSTTTEASAEPPQTKPNVTVPKGAPPTQLETKDLVEGSGAEAKAGNQVTVQYVGVNYKNGKEFDASWDRGEPFSFALGAGEVISGWDQGVAGMKVGGRRELIIPPELAYGEAGAPPAIGPEETLIFVVDLVAVK